MKLKNVARFKLILFEPTYTDDESEENDFSEGFTDEE
jgi:hypothetical protein